MKELRLTNATITFVIAIIIAALISKGRFLGTALKHPSDFLFILFGAVLAYFISSVSIKFLQKGFWKESALLYPIYYYGSLGLFADGHTAGWSHSGDMVEKLVMSQMYILLSFFTLFVPLVIGVISMAHIVLLRAEVKKIGTQQ